MTIKNEPAFPETYVFSECGVPITDYRPGMTQRQWYKGQAIGKLSESAVTEMFTYVGDVKRNEVAKNFAEIIGQLADALLAEDAEFAAREVK
ncbi:MAG: hypothetical protein WC373_15855 [Smithella sp.]|jgi:hypothetical protein